MIEAIAINENSTVGYEGTVVETDIVASPIGPPVVPAPAKPAEKADSKSEAEPDTGAGKKQSWIRIPAWPYADWLAIDEPRIILGQINNLRVSWFDDDCLSLLCHFFLRCAF
jgi:hypothetical protein